MHMLCAEKLPIYYYNMSHFVIQGPVHFDENGIRDVTELQVLQYRTTYVNGTPISHEGDLSYRLRPIAVAYIRKDSESLEFVGKDKNGIWPGMRGIVLVVSIIVYWW